MGEPTTFLLWRSQFVEVCLVIPVLGVAQRPPRLQKMSKDDPHLAMTSDSSPEHILICQVDNDSAPKELGVYKEDTNLYKNCILCTEFKSPPNLVRDKEIYYTWTGSILTCAGLACDLTVQLMEHEGEDQ